MPKYLRFHQLMMEQNAALFAKFKPIHDGFAVSPTEWAAQFHSVGRDVTDICRDWERRLCHGSEKGQYAKFSQNLSDKFWGVIKKDFPLIEQVGLIKS